MRAVCVGEREGWRVLGKGREGFDLKLSFSAMSLASLALAFKQGGVMLLKIEYQLSSLASLALASNQAEV